MRIVFAALAALLGWATLAASINVSVAQDTGVSREPLTRAVPDPQNPVNDAVVSIETDSDYGQRLITPHCTGVLVAPRLVLTAGHCLLGAIVDGGSGQWDSREPIWRAYEMPANRDPAPGWQFGYRGDTRIYRDQDITQYTSSVLGGVADAAFCQSRCERDASCAAWSYQASTRGCAFKSAPRFAVNFGATHGEETRRIVSSSYSVPGYADIAMLRLDEAVPASVAVPALVLSHLPETAQDIATYLRAQRFRAIGFSRAQPTRQRTVMRYLEYPFADGMDEGGDLAMVVVRGAGGATTQGGDSGSPLFVYDTVDGRQRAYVVGILQGFHDGDRNRYTLTGLNLRQRGELLRLPYDRASIDLRRAAPIGEWLTNVMYADFTAAYPRRPLYNWYHEATQDNFLTSDPRWASDPRALVYDSSGRYLAPPRRQGGAGMYRLEGYVFNPHAPQPEGTVPLWSWFSSARGDNFATTDPRWGGSARSVRWEGEHLAAQRSQDGYTQYRLEGYIYDPRRPRPPNTRPLFSWFSPDRGDNFHTTDPVWSIPDADIRIVGENLQTSVTRDGYRLYRLEGYVPTDAGNVTLSTTTLRPVFP